MSELVPCTSCTNGYIETPREEQDGRGEPVVIVYVSTCGDCRGNGMVER